MRKSLSELPLVFRGELYVRVRETNMYVLSMPKQLVSDLKIWALQY